MRPNATPRHAGCHPPSEVRAIGGDTRKYVITRLGKRLQDLRAAFDGARE